MCQLIYFIIAPLADILTLIKGHEDNWLVKLRDTVFSALAFPLGVVSHKKKQILIIVTVILCYSVTS